MGRNDGKDYSVARNGKYTRSKIGNIERHNERKNQLYQNTDIELDRSHLNVYFKKPTDTYLGMFDSMCADGTISTKGLKETAVIIDEMLLDVNTAYFEKHGGYEGAKEFYQKAYAFAVQEAGGEKYILSAVMHADEKNKALSEQLGKDVYHYHLHIMYVPVVQKEVKWSKRCKDKSLIGTVKEVFTQVSHSKKWASHKVKDENGKEHFVKSYSLLQDRFFKYLRDCGYGDIQRGEKGSTEQNLTATEFKVLQEEQRLLETASKVEKSEKALSKIADKQTKIVAIDNVETKTLLMDKSKVLVDKSEFEDIKALARKQIAVESKEKKLTAENKQLRQENQALHKENTLQKKELSEFKSVTNQLNAGKQKTRITELEKFQDVVLKFLDFMGIREKFEQFRKSLNKQRNEVDR
ncbi:plasmid recombination protein [Clostridioides difficile]